MKYLKCTPPNQNPSTFHEAVLRSEEHQLVNPGFSGFVAIAAEEAGALTTVVLALPGPDTFPQ